MKEMTNRFTAALKGLCQKSHDECSLCRYRFKEGDTTHSGYGLNEEELYVCDNCSDYLCEVAIRHYFSPRPYALPEDSASLWRYMDFTKYMNLISTQSLYFARSDCFSDIFEGAKGYLSDKSVWERHYYDFFIKAMTNLPEGFNVELSEKQVLERANNLLKDFEGAGVKQRQSTFISCWHENEYESEAMWRLYSSYLPNALAIKTTTGDLIDSLGCDSSIKIGRVEYIDYRNKFSGVNESFWRKRKSFEHEKEVRAIINDYKCAGYGKNVLCDLNSLINNVYISPGAADWFVDLVRSVNEKYGISAIVNKSDLTDPPFY
ncbi:MULTISPECIES: hypothetical protein [Serratia]|uniref:hypothetical protein n=1 Tax=Serratia TaxID=613 RepID=UPI000744F0F8|nr:hypothetical protein [Serratia marcescens]CAI1802899.1 Uncharacterised protein [Serratia marcescens]CUY67335.1 Uncharacterised protein [Serratia marcescens]CUY75171.1 Uncharacterised protein [Serratia marcescens]CVA17468.1 Uncharacterised protein [Serratia marcescens]CVB21927.1 Uncharacterised protein [Serratia marcescens]